MLRINKNSTNTIILTLNETTTLVNPNYFIELYSIQNSVTKRFFLINDLSAQKIRYNEFIFTENAVEDLDNMVINLIVGDYTYKVYETLGNIIELENANLIEVGKLKVIDGDDTSYDFENNTQEYTFE